MYALSVLAGTSGAKGLFELTGAVVVVDDDGGGGVGEGGGGSENK